MVAVKTRENMMTISLHAEQRLARASAVPAPDLTEVDSNAARF
jgi:hypothetical protein